MGKKAINSRCIVRIMCYSAEALELNLAICHSPARGLYELHMGWGLLVEPLDHSQNSDARELN